MCVKGDKHWSTPSGQALQALPWGQLAFSGFVYRSEIACTLSLKDLLHFWPEYAMYDTLMWDGQFLKKC